MHLKDRLRKILELTLINKVLSESENEQFNEIQHVEFLRLLADKLEELGIH